MAGLSTSPSGSSSRRLSELLEEQQEPFSLDLYLLDKGCSPMLLNAAAGSGNDTSACWPSGLLRLLLSKILHGTAAAAAAAAAASKKKKKKKLPPASKDCSPVDVEKTPSYLWNAVLSPPPRAVEADRVDEADEEEEDEDDDDDDSSKQLSPVSVLEQSTFEQAPKEYAQTIAEAAVIFRELIEAAYKPALLDELPLVKDNSNNYKFKHGRKRNETSTAAAVPAPAPRTRTDRTTGAAAHWEEMFEAELAKVDELIASDMAGAKMWPWDVQPEQRRRNVGYDVAVAVLEELTEEIAVELTGMDHDDAIDNGERSG